MNNRKARFVRILFAWFTALIFIANIPAVGVQAESSKQAASMQGNGLPVMVYFFWGDGCPHCAAMERFFEEIQPQYPNMEVRKFEVWYDEANQELFWKMAQAHGFEPSGVPTIFIGDYHWVGSSEQIVAEITQVLDACGRSVCRDAGAGMISGVAAPTSPSPLESAEPNQTLLNTESEYSLSIPLIGVVDLSSKSLMLSTALIAFVDGFNPCSLWALSVLLAITLHSGSRKKVFLVGGVFLTVTSFIYMLFIAGLFTMFTVVSFAGVFQVVAALAALFFAIVNIKDYFWYKQGISFTIADSKKPGIYEGMRRVMNAGNSTWTLIGATIVLSAGISLVEFSCTAGFPVLWTNLLISQHVSSLTFGALILLYMVIYQVDELILFSLAVFTLRASRFEEKHGRLLKLIGGMLMLTLAVVMLVNPGWMDRIDSSLFVFLIAFGLTALTLVVHRQILPRFGVRIGSEMKLDGRKKGTHRHHSRQA